MKNHRLVMWFLFAGIALISLGHISDALTKVASAVRSLSASSSSDRRSGTARAQLDKAKIPYTRKKFTEASKQGEYETVHLFLESGIDPNVAFEGKTALLQATYHEHVDIVKLLLASGAEVDRPWIEAGITPLMFAAAVGNEAIIRLLIAHGASASKRDNHGFTALTYAAMRCRVSAVEILLQSQADPNSRDEAGGTPLMHAIIGNGCGSDQKTQQRDVIISLFLGGADLDAKADDGETAFNYAEGQEELENLLTNLAGRGRKG